MRLSVGEINVTAICKKCKLEKDVIDFKSGKRNERYIYRNSICSKCTYSEIKNKRNLVRLAVGSRAWRLKNPLKAKAHSVVSSARKSGKLIRPKNCSECNSKGKIHGHHDDYSKPLNVVWLCDYCHKQRHKLMRMK